MSSGAVEKRLKQIQSRLGLRADGLLGPDTLSRIEVLLDQADLPAARPRDFQLICSRTGLQQIARFEISSDAYYRRFLSHPVWPKGQSGITIGIGYDLGYQTNLRFRKDWQGLIADSDLERLAAVTGVKGEAAHTALADVADITIPLDAANQVYYTATLPAYAARTRKVYPGVEKLPADAQAMLLSLIYNRGGSLSGSKRREMKEIVPLVATADLAGIAAEIRAMKRLWGSELYGLLKRRDLEAQIIEHADRDYTSDELIYV
ncbi:hypothetical protein [Mariprofundus ferrooxydans]|uniref:Peptidoglycan binding-like domain-containing protein n=1 Tax=Mariprofundus ferrooxydans PV-1 TaxID=314345 RepID=Q0EYR3_9PROT|nr:hypothetical protein [Mariprofundus ferrooxydans]EAU54494.1 hypothetical protein SPV1_08751 [Mariprofundus ferrooxydans PV-1]KON48417.1 hypothetical protein AL013_03555 [Mariprofundus ferrooxydans]